jgi:hypothetical protein
MTYYDKLENNLNDKEELTRILLEFDYMLKNLHNNGFCIYDFDPKKIVLDNNKLSFDSFKYVLNNIGIQKNAKEINIYQNCKIGLMAYNNNLVDGKMNQEHFEFIRDNLEKFNSNGNIPEEIYEYYEEVFRNNKISYMNDYIIKKQQELNSNQNTNVMRKTLSTDIGRAYSKEDDNHAFVNILFIPSILVLVYLIGLIIYVFVIK